MNGTTKKNFGKSGRSGAVLTLAGLFIMAMALVFGFAACEMDGGDDDGSSFDTALVGKWVNDKDATYWIEIASATSFKIGANAAAMTGCTLSTSGGVLTVTQDLTGTVFGTGNYSISGSTLTWSSPSNNLASSLPAGTYTKQDSGSGTGGGGSTGGGGTGGGGSGTGGGGDDGSGSKPATLATSASYDDFTAKCDAVITYCEVNPSATNTVVKEGVETLKTTTASYSSYWSSMGAAYITQLNTLIGQLDDDDGGDDGSGSGTGGGDDGSGSKPATLATSASYDDFTAKCDAVITYCEVNPSATNTVVMEGVETLKSTAASYSSYWSSMSATYITQLNTLIGQLE